MAEGENFANWFQRQGLRQKSYNVPGLIYIPINHVKVLLFSPPFVLVFIHPAAVPRLTILRISFSFWRDIWNINIPPPGTRREAILI